jgi:hypothetical protein
VASIRITCRRGGEPALGQWLLLDVAVLVELRNIGPQIAYFLFVLDASEDHLGARNLGARVLDVFLEDRLGPGDPGTLVRIAIVEAFRAARS